jgi:pimeloyl-ACP methyl ester carboxylesterase
MKKWILLILYLFLFITRLPAAEEAKRTHLLLLPGLGCPGEVFADLSRQLGPGVTCHTLPWTDALVRAGDDKNPERTVIETLTAYLDQHGLSKVVLAGHSMGGWLALHIASVLPDRIQKLIIIDAVPFSTGLYQDHSPEQALALSRQITQVLGGMDEQQYRAFEGQRLSLMSDDTGIQKQIAAWFATVPRQVGTRLMGCLTASDLRKALGGIQAPTLVLASSKIAARMGLDHSVFEARLRKQFAGMPQYDLFLTAGAGHFIMLEEPDWLAEKIKSFLEIQ